MQYVDQLDQLVVGVLIGYGAWLLITLAARGVPAGRCVGEKARHTPAGLAAIVSMLATPLLIVQWILAGGTELPSLGAWFGRDGSALVPFIVINAAAVLVGLLYPGVWGCLVLWRRIRRRREPLGPKLLLASLLATATMIVTITVVRFESDLMLAHHFADPNAFHRLARTCATNAVLCQIVPAQLWSPDRAGIPAWIARDSTAPSDVLYALARSGDRVVLRAAARNPRLPTEAFRDPAIIRSFEAAFYLVNNPHIPVEALDSLINRYAALRGNLIRDGDYMCKRAAPSTMWILGTDKDEQIRTAAARSPRAPDDLLDSLASDPSPTVRASAREGLRERELARQTQSAVKASCV